MKICVKKLSSPKGVSLLEVLIALFLTGVVLTSIFKVYVTQHKNWTIQNDITDMQQNARAAIDELTRQIRMAGHELPLGLDGIEAYDTNPDTIIITYAEGDCDVPTEQDMPLATSELKCDGHDVSCFYDGQWVYIFHPDSGGGEFFLISQVQVGSDQIEHSTMALSMCYPKGAIVIAMQRIKYFIDNSDTLHPNLMIELPGHSPQVYAENIEDLQFRYTMKNGTVTAAPAIAADIREVSIELTGRTDNPDLDFTQDPYRRRVYASKVNVRNLDI
jgi:Tfp pilus assembly protein PilV